MVQRRCGWLRAESEDLRVAGDILGEKLESDEAMKAVFRLVDNAHVAAPAFQRCGV